MQGDGWAALDLGMIEELRLVEASTGTALLEPLARRVLDGRALATAALTAAVDTGALHAARDHLHRLKGTAASFGLAFAAREAETLHERCGAGALPTHEELRRLDARFRADADTLLRYLASRGEATGS